MSRKLRVKKRVNMNIKSLLHALISKRGINAKLPNFIVFSDRFINIDYKTNTGIILVGTIEMNMI